MSEPLLNSALAVHRAGKLDEAARLYGEILRSEPGNFEAHYLLGVVHSQRGEHAEAKRTMAEALKANPGSPAALFVRGVAMMKQHRHAEAVRTFDEALAAEPDNVRALSGRGHALMELGRLGEALSSLDRALALEAGFVPALQDRAHLLRKLGKHEEAARDAEAYEHQLFIFRHRYVPDLRRPLSFSEKIVHRKLFAQNPVFSVLADKWRVRDYVAARVGPEILNEVFCVVSDPDRIDFAALPNRFVLKATHGAGWNVFVGNKAGTDLPAVRTACRGFLARRFGELENESYYRAIEPRIVAEAFLSDGHGVVPLDYKCYVFHGRCHFIQVHFGRFVEHTSRFFDRDWNPLNYTLQYPLGPTVERPANLQQLIGIAEKLAAGFDFLRVDLYSIGGERVVFGEITVTPGAGREPFGPDNRFDFQLGALW